MALTAQQVHELQEAFSSYSFPTSYCPTFDFTIGTPQSEIPMDALDMEGHIRADLLSRDATRRRNGLANVVWWAFAGRRSGVRPSRIVTLAGTQPQSLDSVNTLGDVVALGLPQFSHMSLCSKLLMFLHPDRCCVLDSQIAKIGAFVGVANLLSRLNIGSTSIPVKGNTAVYDEWCEKVCDIQRKYFSQLSSDIRRGVDVERAFFHLVQTGRVQLAAQILADV